MTQSQLGEALGVTHGAVQRWESGKRQIPHDILLSAARVLGVEPHEILFDVVAVNNIPLIGWVEAGRLSEVEVVAYSELENTEAAQFPGLDPKCHIALEVHGESMNKIAPNGSIIAVDVSQKDLKDGKAYIFLGTEGATFKRYRDSPPRLEPYSSSGHYETIFPKDDIVVIGRVVRVQLAL